ncbi:MAG: trypsin-like peptidase domain-containing protein [Eubacteriales bacterium]|nr:trypsin-like peptidase domain-containing protein [Eubacteriales bacterium]
MDYKSENEERRQTYREYPETPETSNSETSGEYYRTSGPSGEYSRTNEGNYQTNAADSFYTRADHSDSVNAGSVYTDPNSPAAESSRNASVSKASESFYSYTAGGASSATDSETSFDSSSDYTESSNGTPYGFSSSTENSSGAGSGFVESGRSEGYSGSGWSGGFGVDGGSGGFSGNGGNGGSGGGNYTYYNAGDPGNYNGGGSSGRAAKKPKKMLNITRRAFVLILILCMLITSGATFGGFAIYNHYFNNGGNTTYTLASSKETLSYESIIKMNENSVVSITTESVSTDSWAQNYVTQGAGSGIVIKKNGYIMTCAHVVSGASKITVTLANEKTFNATLVGINSSQDIAVLKISASNLDPVTFGDSDKLAVGDQVVAIGNPLGELSGTATTGIISALERKLTIDDKTLSLLQTDASINPGNSGGALFNAQGELIGVVVAKSTGSDVEGLGFAIPVNTAKSVAEDLIKNGSPVGEESESSSSASGSTDQGNTDRGRTQESDHGKIGITVSDVTSDEAESSGLTEGAGLYIIQVTSSSAKSAGLQAGDKIVACGSKAVNSYEELQSALSGKNAGTKITLTIQRNGSQKTVHVTLQ